MAKIELDNFIYYGNLFDIYGKLLSVDRQEIAQQYFAYNMTLAEIAKERNISRQAVLDAIDKSCQKLKEFEDVLGLLELRKKLHELQTLAGDNGKLKSKVKEILKEE